MIRAEPSSAHARDGLVMNLPWTRDAEHLFQSLPFPLRRSIDAFIGDAAPEAITRGCVHALREFRKQLKAQPTIDDEEEEEEERRKSLRTWALKSERVFMEKVYNTQ